MIRSLLFFALTVLSFYSFSQGGVACAEMAPICTDVGLNFTANAGIDQAGTTDPGNDYDCLISQPNPTWYYFQIATDGDIIMELSADQDIDYAIWGPFSTLSVAQSACNSMGDQSPPNPDNGNIVDCSFSPTEVETPIITGAITGEVYVMLITNYAGVVQDIALSQTGGTGSTDCNIVTNPPCSISAFNANPSGCDFTTNTYSVSGAIEYTSPPTSGSLVVEDCNGNTTVVDNFPFAASPQNFSLTGLVSDGLPCDVEVYFTADPTCSQQYNYTSPVCVNNCPAYDLFASSPSEACGNQQYFLEVQNSACDGTVNFEVSGDYGSFPSEISWYVTSNLSGNQVASGSGGAAGGTFNVVVGPIDPNIEGTIFNLVVEDSWGDGFSGGGFIQTEAPDGTVLGGPITGNFGVFSNSYFNSGIIVSSSTITVTTPTGAVTSVVGNCGDHSIPITLQNNNYCTPIVVDLPWMIMCDLTGTLIASGTHSVTVYPQVPTNASDLVSIDWNASTCSWDVTPQNDCDVLDLNVLYSISPDPSSLAAGCSNGTEEFTVTYLGFAEGPDCCSTGGPLIPATYTNNQGTTDFITQTAYGGTNNAAYGTVPGSGIGGNSTAVTIDISGSGYCFPNVPSPPGPPVTGEDDYYVDIYVDGVQISIYGPLSDPPGSFNYTFTHADLLAAGVTYNQNSVIEVYVLPNQFFDPGPPQINTVYIPGANCNTLAAGEWSASDFSIDVTATYEQFVASPANCTFIVNEPFTCCSIGALSATAPANQDVECIGDVPPSDITLVTNIISECPTTVAFVSDVSDGASCPEVITRTYSVTDDCGNSTTVTQTITVDDITAPTASNPAGIDVECVGDVPAFDVTVVSDAADNCTVSPVVAFVSDVSDGASCPEVITRTYSLTDDCGNSTTVTQTITVDDITAPTASNPVGIDVECVGDVPVFDVLVVSDAADNCTVSPVVAFVSDVSDGASCPEVITRTYSATDDCGNSTTVTQTITVNDITAPTATNPTDIVIPIGPAPAPDINQVLDEADNCTVSPVVAFVSDVSDGVECPETITRTYSVTDDCGNQILVTQTIVIGGGNVPEPTVSANGPICEGEDAIFTIEGINDAVVTYDVGLGPQTTVLTGGISIITVPSAAPPNSTITISNISDEACSSVLNLTATTIVNTPALPNFVQLGSYCEGETPGILNTTSIEGITGTWSPTAITTAVPGTSAYTFSEDVGQCAIGATMNVTITLPETPTFTQIAPICINGVAPALLGTSDNGVAGTWNPSVINTAIAGTNTYTFAPDAGLCAISATMDIVIEPAVQSSFTQLGTYCEGETPGILNTTSIEGITGTWSPSAINTAAPGTSTYTFSIDVGQCALGTSMNISISAPIVTAFTQVDPICINGTAPILSGTSDNGITGSWTPSTVNTATIGTGLYTFTPDPGICATSASMDIVIDPATQASFTQLGSYCQGETSSVLTNTSIEGITGTWSPTAITTAVPGTSTYTFSEDVGQCAIGATMNVTITPPETPTFTQIAPICINGGAPALPGTSDNGFTGTWTPSTINTATAGISTYTFTPDAGLCTISATMDITIVELPFVDPGADQIISCITNVGGAQIGSPAAPGNTYSWSPSADLTDANNSNPIANPMGTTTYTVTVTNSSGCLSAGQVNVSVDNAPPIIAITNNTATNILTCTVLALNVTASGGLNYSWDSGLGNDAAATITAPGIYTVTGTAPNGCQETESIEVTQDNNIDLFVTLSEPEICSGEEITLTVNSTIATDFDWTVIQNGVTGASAGALPSIGVGAEITQTLQLTSSNNGEVEYIITPTSGGCIGESQSVTVYILSPIEPQFDALGPFCINETPTSFQVVSNEGVSGTWNPSTISTTLAGTSNYIFTPNPDQCALTQNIDILINELPLVSFSADNLVGCAPHVVNLTSTNGSGTWTVGNGVVLEGTQAQVTLFNPGCYDVTLEIEQDGCANSLTTENYLCVEEAPVADFTATPDVFTDQDVLVSFTNLSIGASSFIWDFGDQNTSAYINPSNLYESTEEGALITLIAVSDFGCTDEAQLIIEYEEQEVFYVPNTFTPDGDNFNQMFTPVFYSGFDPYNFEMLIYNRWGELVFESQNADMGWDGTYGLSGMKASDGAYTWKITYKNPKTDQRKVILGHVTLIR